MDALSLMSKVFKDYEFLSSINFSSSLLKNEISTGADKVATIIRNRSSLFSNDLTELLGFLDPSTSDDLNPHDVCKVIAMYFKDLSGELSDPHIKEIENGIAAFLLRSQDEKRIGCADFWRKRKLKFPHIAAFVDMLMSALLTEASVERSFSRQSAFMARERNRLSDNMVGDLMMIKQFVEKPSPLVVPKSKPRILSLDLWRELALTLGPPENHPAYSTRRAEKEVQARSLQFGDTVVVNWTGDEGMQEWVGVVTAVLGEGKYKVFYRDQHGRRREEDFHPLGKDSQWRMKDAPEDKK